MGLDRVGSCICRQAVFIISLALFFIGIADRSAEVFIVLQRYSRRCNDRLLVSVGQLLRGAAPRNRRRGLADGKTPVICALIIPDGHGHFGCCTGVYVIGINHRIIRARCQRRFASRDGHFRLFLGAVINQVICNGNGHAVPALRAGAGRPAENVGTVRRRPGMAAVGAVYAVSTVVVGGRCHPIMLALLHGEGAGAGGSQRPLHGCAIVLENRIAGVQQITHGGSGAAVDRHSVVYSGKRPAVQLGRYIFRYLHTRYTPVDCSTVNGKASSYGVPDTFIASGDF